MERLAAAGYIDNARAASVRAESMAAREYGDEAIRIDLRGRELSAEEIDVAIAGLTPEAERARVIVLRDGPEPKTARRLAAKGFSEETVESAIGSAASSDL